MLLNIEPLMQLLPGWGMWFFGPHMGGFNFLLFFLIMFLVFSFLRGSGHGRYNRHRGGYYRPGPPQYHSGHPYGQYGPLAGDAPDREQSNRESSAYGPEAEQQRSPFGYPSLGPYPGYGPGATPSGEGQATLRVDPPSNGEGQPTMRVTPPATTVRMETAETTGQATTPLGSTPVQPSEKARTEPGEVAGNDDRVG